MKISTQRVLWSLSVLALAAGGCDSSDPPSSCTGPECDEVDATGDVDAGEDTTASDARPDAPDRDVGQEDTGADAEDDTSPDAEPDAEPDVESDPDEDIVYPPLELTTNPEDGATFVPLDTDFSFTFNQPMNALRFIPSNVTLTEFEGAVLPLNLNYDADSTTLTATTDPAEALLRPVTPYELKLNDVIASVSGEELGDDYLLEFSTTGYDGRGFHRQLAEAYAPVVYQQVEELTIDTFTRIDFDGDLSPANNLEATTGAGYGYSYYDVAETVSHFFLTYLYYYPGSHPRSGITYEHDVVMAQLVVQKRDDDPLGRLRSFSTFYHENLNVWLLDSYPDGEGVSGGDEGTDGWLSADLLEGGRHPSIFVESGRHAVCLPNQDTLSGPCAPSGGATAPFEEETIGLVYRVAEAALRYGDAEDTELTYSLRNFVEEFWALRNRTSGPDAVFGGGYNYSPPAVSDEELRPGEGEVFPTALNSDDATGSFGDLPFIYNATGDREDEGVWFADPAWGALEIFNFTESFSVEYCFNPYLNIDARDELAGCTPTSFVLP